MAHRTFPTTLLIPFCSCRNSLIIDYCELMLHYGQYNLLQLPLFVSIDILMEDQLSLCISGQFKRITLWAVIESDYSPRLYQRRVLPLNQPPIYFSKLSILLSNGRPSSSTLSEKRSTAELATQTLGQSLNFTIISPHKQSAKQFFYLSLVDF